MPAFFRLHDVDHDRRLSPRELAVLYGGHDYDVDLDAIEEQIVDPLLDRFDTDRDGYLSLDEYRHAIDVDDGVPSGPRHAGEAVTRPNTPPAQGSSWRRRGPRPHARLTPSPALSSRQQRRPQRHPRPRPRRPRAHARLTSRPSFARHRLHDPTSALPRGLWTPL